MKVANRALSGASAQARLAARQSLRVSAGVSRRGLSGRERLYKMQVVLLADRFSSKYHLLPHFLARRTFAEVRAGHAF
jgi:hypothetical protein